MSEQTIRVFISSPGDVQDERERARNVVHQLRRRYAGRLDLKALLWEDLPLQADMSFQQGIDVVLSQTGVDLAIFILWSRLGSPTGPLMVGDEGKPYRSGTEREWDLMLRARDRCVREGEDPRPAIIVYTRKDEVSFEERLRGKTDDKKADQIAQKQLVTEFISEEFRDAETGVNIRAVHSFGHPTTFAQKLRVHLTNFLDPLAGDGLRDPVWNITEQGPPFRGLESFEYEHAPIFFGREDEIVSIRTILREQACHGCGFVLISGPSGSGKSSLARAGVLPDVCQYELDADIRKWRWLALKPSQLGSDMLAGLVKSMMGDGVLPELKQWVNDVVVPQKEESNIQDWLTRFELRVCDALKSATEQPGSTRLILLLDQLEELFSNAALTDQARLNLIAALEALARSGMVWVVATVRSDFYQDCQTIPALVRMKDGGGQFDLLPPTSDAILRVITGPAQVAGLRFERDGEQTLADFILREAAEHRELLPLVEYLLLELCKVRSSDGTLMIKEYHKLGGVEGALRQRCEETFAGVSQEAQAALESVLPELVTLGGEGEQDFVRRSVPKEQFKQDAAQEELVQAMIDARLFTANRGADDQSIVSVAHEALLRVWPRVVIWINNKRELLRLRVTVEQAYSRWEFQGRDSSLLLPSGLPLEEGRYLIDNATQYLREETKTFIRASIANHEIRLRRKKNRQRIVLFSISLLALFTTIVAFLAVHQSKIARTEKERSQNMTYDVVLRRVSEIYRSDPEQAATLLDDCPSGHREFAWKLFQHLTPRWQILIGHDKGINDVQFSPGGRTIATAGDDGTVRIWSVENKKQTLSFTDHGKNEVLTLDYSPSGNFLISGGKDHNVFFRDLTEQRIKSKKIEVSDVVRVVNFVDEDHFLIGTQDGQIVAVDRKNMSKVDELCKSSSAISCLVVLKSGSFITGDEAGNLTKWNSDGKEIKSVSLRSRDDKSSGIWSLKLSPDESELLVSTIDWDKKWPSQVSQVDSKSLQLSDNIPVAMRTVHSVAISNKGNSYALGGEATGHLHLLNRKTHEAYARLSSHKLQIWDIDYAPGDDSLLASASFDGQLILWHVPPREHESRKLEIDTQLAVLSRDCKSVVVSRNDNSVYLISLSDQSASEIIIKQPKKRIQELAVSQDGQQFAIVKESGLLIYEKSKMKSPRLIANVKTAIKLAFNFDGSKILVSLSDGSLKEFETHTGKVCRHLNFGEPCHLVLYSEESDDFIAAGDHSCKLFSVDGKEENLNEAKINNQVLSCSFSPDGSEVALGGSDGIIRIYSLGTERKKREINAHKNSIFSLAWDSDGRTLASIGKESPVRLWNPVNGQLRAELGKPQSRDCKLYFDSSGSALHSISATEIRTWKTVRSN